MWISGYRIGCNSDYIRDKCHADSWQNSGFRDGQFNDVIRIYPLLSLLPW